MGNTVSPSDVNPQLLTRGQAGKLADLIVAAVLKLGLPSDLTQQVLERQGATLANECALLLKKRVEALSNLIIRRVRVNRSRTPQEMLNATGRKKYTQKHVVKAIPRGEGDEVEVIFFKIGRRCLSNEELENEFHLRGLKPADVYALAAVNEADPSFADERPNCTCWKSARGTWRFATFFRWSDERYVNVYRYDYVWNAYWWFAGVRK